MRHTFLWERVGKYRLRAVPLKNPRAGKTPPSEKNLGAGGSVEKNKSGGEGVEDILQIWGGGVNSNLIKLKIPKIAQF